MALVNLAALHYLNIINMRTPIVSDGTLPTFKFLLKTTSIANLFFIFFL